MKVVIDDSYLKEIADSIRKLTETTDGILVENMGKIITKYIEDKLTQSGVSYVSCECINNDWLFKILTNSVTSKLYTDSDYQTKLNDLENYVSVNLPHDWSIYNDFNSASKSTYEGGYLDGGDVWYKKSINIEKDNDTQYILYFEGIYMESDIIVNGTHLKSHKNGYTNFFVDMTDVVTNGMNEIAVFVKNKQPSSRWYSGSGIYRDVYFIKTNKVSMKQQGIKITTPNLETEYTNGYCDTNIECILENKTDKLSDIKINYTVKLDDTVVATKTENVSINANSEIIKTITIRVDNPVLWDEYDGNYYTLTVEITNDKKDTLSHTETYFGYRWFKFEPNTGFWLNGKNIKLRGACMHHDLGVLGAEINQSAIDRQIMKLKDAGFNAIRLTHNPSCSEFTNACMRMGIMCIEEAFDCWTIYKKANDYARFFLDYAEEDVKSMVRRSINNPSVIMWSLGNEIYDTRSTKADSVLQDPVETATQLRNWVREIDTTRPCTIGENQIQDATAQLVSDVLDVQGFNYNSSRYKSMHTAHPDWCVYGSETTSAISSRGIYARDDVNKQCSSYDDDKVSWGSYAYSEIAKMNEYNYCAGMFIWTGWDYIGEPTPFNKYPSRSSYFGIIDIAGLLKDAYYLYQSMWTEKPMCHIVPMDWTNWTVGEEVNIMVYSNAKYIKMYLNGEYIETYNNKANNSASKYSFYGKIPFKKGRLIANAYNENDELVAQDIIYTSYAPTGIELISDKTAYTDKDLLFVEIDIIDKENHLCISANNIVSATCENGEIVGVDNGNATSVEKYRSATKPVFSGKAVCVIRPHKNSNSIILNVTSDGLNSKSITILRGNETILNNATIDMIDATTPYEYMEEKIPCENIVLNANSIILNNTTRTFKLEPSVTPSNTTDNIVFRSDDTSIALVDTQGFITAINNGSCRILVSCGTVEIACEITVEGMSIDCESITLSDTSLILTNTSQHDITASVLPANCTYEVEWTTSDSNVVVIDNGGHFTAVANGTADIIATCGSKTAICSIVVELTNEDNPPIEDIPAENSKWDIVWEGEETLPEGFILYGTDSLTLNETTQKYELVTLGNTVSDEVGVCFDSEISPNSIIEVEVYNDDWVNSEGSGWYFGIEKVFKFTTEPAYYRVCAISVVRSGFPKNYLYYNNINVSNIEANKLTELNSGEITKITIDSTKSNAQASKSIADFYINDKFILESSTKGKDKNYKNSYGLIKNIVYTTSPQVHIRAIRYKKDGRELL